MQKSDFCKKVELQPSCAKPSIYSAKHKIAILTFSTEVIHNIIKKEFKTNLSLFAV